MAAVSSHSSASGGSASDGYNVSEPDSATGRRAIVVREQNALAPGSNFANMTISQLVTMGSALLGSLQTAGAQTPPTTSRSRRRSVRPLRSSQSFTAGASSGGGAHRSSRRSHRTPASPPPSSSSDQQSTSAPAPKNFNIFAAIHDLNDFDPIFSVKRFGLLTPYLNTALHIVITYVAMSTLAMVGFIFHTIHLAHATITNRLKITASAKADVAYMITCAAMYFFPLIPVVLCSAGFANNIQRVIERLIQD